MTPLVLLLLFVHACAGLKLPTGVFGRRTAIQAASGLCASNVLLGRPPAFAAALDDDDDDGSDEDFIPDPGRAVPKKKAKTDAAPIGKDLSPADGKAAAAQILAARRQLDSVDGLLKAGDFAAVKSLLSTAPVSTFEQNALVLVQSKALGPDDVKAIGTIKRYGAGADAIIMLGGLGAAAGKKDAGEAASYAEKAKASFDEIIAICKGAKIV